MTCFALLLKRNWFGVSSESGDSNEPQLISSVKTSLDQPALRCQCHSEQQPDRPHALCKACRRFVDDCRWIQIFKLPPSEFAKISKRQWKRGSYIVDGDASRGLNWEYNLSFRETSRGCHLCELIGTVWEGHPSDSGSVKFDRIEQVRLHVYYNPGLPNRAQLNVKVRDFYGAISSTTLDMYHEWKIPEHTKKGQPSNPSGTDPTDATFPMGKCTGSNSCFDQAKAWLENCRCNHEHCSGARKSGSFPSRLIDVGTELREPFLIETPHKPLPEYLTMSHCWGGESPLMLTVATLEEYKRRISFAALPKTFQEAITIVRRLGFSYIWIDSLCIIQDAKDDWKRESEFMGDIYSNSLCTIAATASTNGDGGCFRLRNTLRSRPCQVWGDDERGIFIGTGPGDSLDRYRRDVSSGPLNKRAWVIQERYLSPRILHYSETGVYWDCQQEHFSDGNIEISDEKLLSWGFGFGLARLFDINSDSFLDDFADRWKFAVERYTGMGITVKSDRIPAFTGVVKYLEGASKLKCFSGLWETHILSHLLWRVPDAFCAPSQRIPEPGYAPSWSWQSVDAPVHYFPSNEDDLASTFWHPESEGGWNNAACGGPNAAADTVAEILMRQELGVDPENGYSSEAVFCCQDLECTKTSLLIGGKLDQAPTTPIIPGDRFSSAMTSQIVETLTINPEKPAETTNLIICAWPDLSWPLPPNELLFYLPIATQGAKSPRVYRFLSHDSAIDTDEELAPYALHTTGLVLTTIQNSDEYERVGYFRAIETFSIAPGPHPEGVDVNNPFFENSWFGQVRARKIRII